MQTEKQDRFASDEASKMAQAARRELDDAKARLSQAADRVRHEASHAGSTISTLVLDELDRRAADMGAQLQSVARHLRCEGDDDQAEQSAEMLGYAADLVEDVSSRMQGQSIREMGDRLGRFGRENPALFAMGCLLTGVLAGRMIVASDASVDRNGADRSQDGYRFSGHADRAQGGQGMGAGNTPSHHTGAAPSGASAPQFAGGLNDPSAKGDFDPAGDGSDGTISSRSGSGTHD